MDRSALLPVPYETFFDLVPDGLVMHEIGRDDVTPLFIHANPAVCRMLGYSPEEMRGLTPLDIQDEAQLRNVTREAHKLLAEGGLCFEKTLVRKDGTKFPAEINSRLFYDDGRPMALSSIRDITGRKEAENALQASEERFRRYFELGLIGMAVTSPREGIIEANDEICRMLGYERGELLHMTWDRLTHPDDLAVGFSWFSRLLSGEIDGYELDQRYVRKDGRVIDTMISLKCLRKGDGSVDCVVALVQDTTERRNLEEQLRQAQKMEAIGTLAGGVAHDFNNILTVITGLGNVIQMSLDPGDHLRPHIDQIVLSAERAADLTRSLLVFSRKQQILLGPHRVAGVVESAAKLLRRLLPEDIELRIDVADRGAVAMLDVAQIDQVLMNLATNARDAMPHGGSLTIGTRAVRLDASFKKAHGFGKPGRYVRLSVSDTGVGMNDTTRARIFDPFFTTKDVGKGTGLGLASVYGIVKQHAGYITVESVHGSGTTFDVYLPLVEGGGPDEAKTAEIRGGTETVLVIEDDPDVRRMISAILGHQGYISLVAEDGEEALRVFGERKAEIGLLILDVVMPGKNGKEVFDEIARVSPGVKAIFVSGYTGDVVLGKGVHEERVDFLQKPLSAQKLLAKVREVLDRE